MSTVLRVVAVLALSTPAIVRAQLGSAIADSIERVLATGSIPGASMHDLMVYRPSLARMYAASTGQPLWTASLTLTRQATQLIATLDEAGTRGLDPRDYDGPVLRRLGASLSQGTGDSLGDVARFDVWLSLAAARFVTHLHRGRVDPATLGFALPRPPERLDLAATLLAMSQGTNVDSVLTSLEPSFARYRVLKDVLARYRALAADTAMRPPPTLATSVRPGEEYAGMAELRRLLSALGDLPKPSISPASADSLRDSLRFAGDAVDAVKSFQRRHGLDPDGVLGRATVAELRLPLQRRVRQIELTLERWRWLHDDQPQRYAVVNIPGFRLYLFDRKVTGEAPVVRMDVIVGQSYRRRTPVFVGSMRYVTFQPYWDVPPSIARNEVVPAIRRDRGYFYREEMEIVGRSENALYEPTSTNLARVASGALRIRQRPGPRNPLGAVKFIFPNPYNVYLHGTSARHLFERSRRDFSHGCIRASDPNALAEFALRHQPGWDSTRIDGAMNGARTVTVTLAEPIPVYVLYATVVLGERGDVFFLPDIYRHDATLERALAGP